MTQAKIALKTRFFNYIRTVVGYVLKLVYFSEINELAEINERFHDNHKFVEIHEFLKFSQRHGTHDIQNLVEENSYRPKGMEQPSLYS